LGVCKVAPVIEGLSAAFPEQGKFYSALKIPVKSFPPGYINDVFQPKKPVEPEAKHRFFQLIQLA
jgi:hypothetical protein